MIPQNTPPGYAQDLARIHRVITRGLEVGARHAAQYAERGFPDARTRQGFLDYVQSLTAVLNAHHLGEDEIGFPALRLKLPGAPYDRLATEHQEIVRLLGQVNSAMDALAAETPTARLAGLTGLLTAIAEVWRPHIEMEESHFSHAAITAVMEPDEQGRLSASLAKHSQEYATPNSRAMPFVLFNLEPEDRAAMVQLLPKVLVEELVPIVWKDQWAPMKPFLLD
jgi:hemerythrin-like domain-containing protein